MDLAQPKKYFHRFELATACLSVVVWQGMTTRILIFTVPGSNLSVLKEHIQVALGRLEVLREDSIQKSK